MQPMQLGLDPLHLLMNQSYIYKDTFKRLNTESSLEVSLNLKDIFYFTEATVNKALVTSLNMESLVSYAERIYASVHKYVNKNMSVQLSTDSSASFDDLFNDNSEMSDTTNYFGDSDANTVDAIDIDTDNSSGGFDDLFSLSENDSGGDSGDVGDAGDGSSFDDLFGSSSESSDLELDMELDMSMDELETDIGFDDIFNELGFLNKDAIVLLSEEEFKEYVKNSDSYVKPSNIVLSPLTIMLSKNYKISVKKEKISHEWDTYEKTIKKTWELLKDISETQLDEIFNFIKRFAFNKTSGFDGFECYGGYVNPLVQFGQFEVPNATGPEFLLDNLKFILLYQLKEYMDYEEANNSRRIDNFKTLLTNASKEANPRKQFLSDDYYNLSHYSKNNLISANRLYSLINASVNEDYKSYIREASTTNSGRLLNKINSLITSVRDVSEDIYSEKLIHKTQTMIYGALKSENISTSTLSVDNIDDAFEVIAREHLGCILSNDDLLRVIWNEDNFSKYPMRTEKSAVFQKEFEKIVLSQTSPLHVWFKTEYISLIMKQEDKSRVNKSVSDTLRSIETVLSVYFQVKDFSSVTLFDFITLETLEKILSIYLTPVKVPYVRAQISQYYSRYYNSLFYDTSISELPVAQRTIEIDNVLNNLTNEYSSVEPRYEVVFTPWMIADILDGKTPLLICDDGKCKTNVNLRGTSFYTNLKKDSNLANKADEGVYFLMNLYQDVYEYKLLKNILTHDGTIPLSEGLDKLTKISLNLKYDIHTSQQVREALDILQRWDDIQGVMKSYRNQCVVSNNTSIPVLQDLLNNYGIIGLNNTATRMFEKNIVSQTAYSVNSEYETPSRQFTANLIMSYRAISSVNRLMGFVTLQSENRR